MAFLISSSAAASLTSSSCVSGASSLVPLFMSPPQTSSPTLEGTTSESFKKHLTLGPATGGWADKFSFADFVFLVRNAPPLLRALPIPSIESYQKSGENVGLVPYWYSVLTIQCPHGGSTYLKLQLRALEGTLMSILTAELADDRSALIRPHDRRLAVLELTPTHAASPAAPTLAGLAELLDIIQKRVGWYDPTSWNCLWLADLVLFSSAMKFKDVWLTEGRIYSDWPIRKYMRGEMDVLSTSTQCFLSEDAPGWMGITYGVLGRVFGTFDMQREVEDVVRKWRDAM